LDIQHGVNKLALLVDVRPRRHRCFLVHDQAMGMELGGEGVSPRVVDTHSLFSCSAADVVNALFA